MEKERLIQEIATLKSELAAVMDSAAFLSSSRAVGTDPLPKAIRCSASRVVGLDRYRACPPARRRCERRADFAAKTT
jgi:hypothetical protein